MPSRPSRAPLDPYGIYGTRTANRLRSSRQRRQMQNVLLVFIVLGLIAAVVFLLKWRRVDTRGADAIFATGVAVNVAPIWAQDGDSTGALLVAGEDGRLVRFDDIERQARKTELLRTDFPLHAPLVVREKVFVPSQDGVLTALDWQSGRQLWRARFDTSLTAQPTAFSLGQKQVVVAGSDAGLVMGIDVGNGGVLWRVRLPAPIGNGFASVSANGRARVLVPLLGGSAMRGGVWCLDGATGQVLWRFPPDGPTEAFQFSTPIAHLSGNRAYAANDLGVITSLNLTTGTYDPNQSVGWKTFALPLSEQESAQHVLLRAAPLLLNSQETTNGVNRRGEILIVGGNDGGVRCLSTRDGSLLWQFRVRAPVQSLHGLRDADGRNLVLVLSRSARLHLLDSNTGAVVRRFSSGGATFVGMAVSKDHLFAVTESGAIHRFALSQ